MKTPCGHVRNGQIWSLAFPGARCHRALQPATHRMNCLHLCDVWHVTTSCDCRSTHGITTGLPAPDPAPIRVCHVRPQHITLLLGLSVGGSGDGQVGYMHSEIVVYDASRQPCTALIRTSGPNVRCDQTSAQALLKMQ
jgi:hypothetical protein